jgi:hypothetical protein
MICDNWAFLQQLALAWRIFAVEIVYSQLLHSAASLEHGISSWTKQEIQRTMKWGGHKNAWMMDMDGFCALQEMYCSYLMLFESI